MKQKSPVCRLSYEIVENYFSTGDSQSTVI